jgi:uncharacterized protein
VTIDRTFFPKISDDRVDRKRGLRIAVIGSGISGLACAWLLRRDHEVFVFEKNASIGGHTHTVKIHANDAEELAIDTGFIVFNPRTYPNFVSMLELLHVPSQDTDMSFSVRWDAENLEYSGRSVSALFSQRRNLLRLSHWKMLRDLTRFFREAPRFLDEPQSDVTLGQYLQNHGYSEVFIHRYLIPLGAAIWSTDLNRMLDFPAQCFIRFQANHGMLSFRDRPTWKSIVGGSKRYVDALTSSFPDRIFRNTAITGIERQPDGMKLFFSDQAPQTFDRVILATHSDQALRLLRNPSHLEEETLKKIPYQTNEAVLHTDTRLLPRRKAAWAAWNYRMVEGASPQPSLTYNMNYLQRLTCKETFLVTLNQTDAIRPDLIRYRVTYEHPLFTREALAAQKAYPGINGADRIYFAGAYWRYGFHEDGLQSALAVGEHFGVQP